MTAFHLDTDISKEAWKSYEVNKKQYPSMIDTEILYNNQSLKNIATKTRPISPFLSSLWV